MSRPCLINRVPEPGDVGVLVNTDIELDLTDTGGGTVDSSATQVFVGGVLAYDGGIFQTGFTGPNSADSNPQADTLRIIIDPNDYAYIIVVISEEPTAEERIRLFAQAVDDVVDRSRPGR